MARLKATAAMKAVPVDPATDRAMDETAKARGYESWAAYQAALRARKERRAAVAAKDPEVGAARERLSLLASVAAELNRTPVGANVDSFTAAVRGYEINGKVIKALAPNVHVLRLYAPGNGKGGLITRDQLVAAGDYACLSDQVKVGGASRDPGDIQVDGGGGGSAELSLINRIDAVKRLRAAEAALAGASSAPAWAGVIRRIVDWICLDGGHPLEDFTLAGPGIAKGKNEVKACKGMAIAQGLDVLCQHFRKG
ncbi:hypothetical protein [Maricaulis sp.]|uniref:hypothetical protein n=1 Tax=Maricaulis sp. TaxID=1486257 RepID=UPI003A914259